MSLFHAILLGVIQGVTEFLPISSDGHLVIADALFSVPLEGADALGFDVLLHAGSLVAILLSYLSVWKTLIAGVARRESESLRIAGFLIVATIPGAVAGVLFGDIVGDMRSFTIAGLGFIATGLTLIVGERIGRAKNARETLLSNVGFPRAFITGCAQAIAILPGVSRSGSTVAMMRALGFDRRAALDFSFLMAAPIIAGAVAKILLDVRAGDVAFPPIVPCVAGFLSSFFVSMIAIAILKRFTVHRSFAAFAAYVIPLGIACVLIGAYA